MIHNNYLVIVAQSVKDLPDIYPVHFALLSLAVSRLDTCNAKLIIPWE
jgi:hypothetical protein